MEKKKGSIVLKIIVIVFILYLLFRLLYTIFIIGIATIIFSKISSPSNINYFLDYNKKMYDNDILEYIEEKYNTEFEIINVSKKQLQECRTNFAMTTNCKDILKDEAFEYTYIIKSKDNIYFYLHYKDPYYKQKDGQNNYIENVLEDDYLEYKKINNDEILMKIKNDLKIYFNDNLKEAKLDEIYFFNHQNPSLDNHLKLYIKTENNLDYDNQQKVKEFLNNIYKDSTCIKATSVNIDFCDYNVSFIDNKEKENNIVFDEGVKFINNQVSIMFNDDVVESRKLAIIEEIGGKVISNNKTLNSYLIETQENFFTYNSISDYCEELENKYKEIDIVSPNTIVDLD